MLLELEGRIAFFCYDGCRWPFPAVGTGLTGLPLPLTLGVLCYCWLPTPPPIATAEKPVLWRGEFL